MDFQKWQMNEPYHFGNTRDATIESRESRGKEKVVNTPNAESSSKYRKKYQMERKWKCIQKNQMINILKMQAK